MAYILTTENVGTRIYQEIIDLVSRSDDETVEAAINAAIAEAAGYMSRYDIDKILGTASDDAEIQDANLLSKLKDLFAWHFIALANPNMDYTAAHDRYVLAIDYFKQVQKGTIAPKDWPYLDTTDQTAPPDGDSIYHISNTKRNNYY